MSRKRAAKNAASAVAEAREKKATVEQVLADDELRESVRAALDAARDAAESVKAAKERATKVAKPQKQRGGGFGRLVLLAVVGAIAAVALSADLRNKVLDALFGAEEEFDYTSTTAPAPAPAPAATAS